MSDKIRIVGVFGEGAVDKVQEFVKGLDGVESVSLLHDGTETYPKTDSVKTAQNAPKNKGTKKSPTPKTTPDESVGAA
jgi:hypothetical protein